MKKLAIIGLGAGLALAASSALSWGGSGAKLPSKAETFQLRAGHPVEAPSGAQEGSMDQDVEAEVRQRAEEALHRAARATDLQMRMEWRGMARRQGSWRMGRMDLSSPRAQAARRPNMCLSQKTA